MANHKCIECGSEFDESQDYCPNCGCPIEHIGNTTPNMDSSGPNTNNYGSNENSTMTEPEHILSDYSNTILILCNYFIIPLSSIIIFISGFYAGTQMIQVGLRELGVIVIVIYLLLGIGSFFLFRWLAKVGWAWIMLFVDMSKTIRYIASK